MLKTVVLLAALYTAAVWSQETKPAPVAAPVVPDIIKPVESDPKKVMLTKLIQAGILMLEGKAYQQFIQAFVSEDDRRRFEQAFSKNGPVNYEAWGRDKGEQMLKVLVQISAKEPLWLSERACFVNENFPSQKFSFVFVNGSWFIENHSKKCPTIVAPPTPAREAVKP